MQGIGTALYEEIPYDEAGQPLAGTLADYLLPGAAEMPAIKIGHLHTPTPHTEYGMKGMGEGGAVAPPAAIANAVRDALARHRRRGQRNPDHPTPRDGGDKKGARGETLALKRQRPGVLRNPSDRGNYRSQGLITGMRVSSKSPTLRVTMILP